MIALAFIWWKKVKILLFLAEILINFAGYWCTVNSYRLHPSRACISIHSCMAPYNNCVTTHIWDRLHANPISSILLVFFVDNSAYREKPCFYGVSHALSNPIIMSLGLGCLSLKSSIWSVKRCDDYMNVANPSPILWPVTWRAWILWCIRWEAC